LSNVLVTCDVTPLSLAETYQHYITYIFEYKKVKTLPRGTYWI